eukprot:2792717-Rhodomonas_salina.1
MGTGARRPNPHEESGQGSGGAFQGALSGRCIKAAEPCNPTLVSQSAMTQRGVDGTIAGADGLGVGGCVRSGGTVSDGGAFAGDARHDLLRTPLPSSPTLSSTPSVHPVERWSGRLAPSGRRQTLPAVRAQRHATSSAHSIAPRPDYTP